MSAFWLPGCLLRNENKIKTNERKMERISYLESGTGIGKLTDPVEDGVDDFLSDGVMATSVVVGSIFLAADDLFGVVQLRVLSSPDFVTNGRFQVDEDGTGDMLSGRRFGKERVERVVGLSDRLVGRHVAIRVDVMLEAVQLPAVVTDLDTGLAEVDGDTFTHFFCLVGLVERLKGWWLRALGKYLILLNRQ